MAKFWELFGQSVILSGFIVIVCLGTLCYLAIMGRLIPEVLVNISLIVVSFFFGTKATAGVARVRHDSTNPLP